jgi:crossover junction endodeoxyribonuclease RuvC
MRIVGIDPGIARNGWGVIQDTGNKISTLAYDCFETPKTDSAPVRLVAIYNFMHSLLTKYKPDALSIEELFFNKNVSTALVVGQARGVVILSAAQLNIPVISYTPLQVKMALTGYGRADKSQIGQMVKSLLFLQTIPKPDDTADALAIALTHAFSYKLKAKSSKLQL